MDYARRRCGTLLLASLLSVSLLGASSAESWSVYPSRPIKLVVPYAPGGGTDVIARIFADRLSRRFQQRVYVENHPGAGGNLGAALVTKADPDGYTILFTPQGPITIAPNFQRPLPYKPAVDLIPIALVAEQPVLFAVNKNVHAKDLRDFVELAKKEPGKLNFGSAGVGTEMDLTVEMLKLKTGIQMVHLPYRGGGPAISALLRGDIALMPVVPSSIAPYVKSGQVRILATTSSKRLEEFPNVPTTEELGFPDINIRPWWGLFVPKGTPREIVHKIGTAALNLAGDDTYRKRMDQMSTKIVSLSGEKFKTFLKDQTALWGTVIKRAHLELK